MDVTQALYDAIRTVVAARRQSADVAAIWRKLDRTVVYLDAQLSAALQDWEPEPEPAEPQAEQHPWEYGISYQLPEGRL